MIETVSVSQLPKRNKSEQKEKQHLQKILKINTTTPEVKKKHKKIECALLNIVSLSSKTALLHKLISDHNIDLFWKKPSWVMIRKT